MIKKASFLIGFMRTAYLIVFLTERQKKVDDFMMRM